MAGFRFERDLAHQSRAVASVAELFAGLPHIPKEGLLAHFANPRIAHPDHPRYLSNLQRIMARNAIPLEPRPSPVVDVMMETGTGKTYTYTKTIFELNRRYGLYKFVIVVPSLSIKAGVENFLVSSAAREHFRDLYGKRIELYVLESKRGARSDRMPSAVTAFAEAPKDPRSISVLLVNMGMLNSETMARSYDKAVLESCTSPFEAIAALDPILIVDEPHRFAQANKTWRNILRLGPQAILRYGATFLEYENLVYSLTAAEAFNQNLVKGVVGYIQGGEEGKKAMVRLVELDGKEARFEVTEGARRSLHTLGKKASLSLLHPAISDLFIENLNKTEVLLSNGMRLRKKEKFNPYIFSETLEEAMIKAAVKKHFEIERELIDERALRGLPKIKPLTLFFIDNIDEYRSPSGKLRTFLERTILHYTKEALKSAQSDFYRAYLRRSLEEISRTHGGYFSKDNQEKDEAIEQEIDEILHDKEALLDLANPRKFIFSKWTLKEGWDNPNIFVICKLRSSGSEISKLQEVGRGLRLPVNEYMARQRGEFYLHYFVDFGEEDFIKRLVAEINAKSHIGAAKGAKSATLAPGRVKRAEENARREVAVRAERYGEFGKLWERLSQKAMVEYHLTEEEFAQLLYRFLAQEGAQLLEGRMEMEVQRVAVEKGRATIQERQESQAAEAVNTMGYREFLTTLAAEAKIRVATLHKVFVRLKKEGILDITRHRNHSAIAAIKRGFENYLLAQSLAGLGVELRFIEGSPHPTKLTDARGRPLGRLDAADMGARCSEEATAPNCYVATLCYDSATERADMQSDDERVRIFTKLPKNSLKIPLPGAKSCAPHFLYMLEEKAFLLEILQGEPTAEQQAKMELAKRFLAQTLGIGYEAQKEGEPIRKLIDRATKK